METLTANLSTAKVRSARWRGRDYLVAPVTMIVPGVLPGSKGPLYYPPDEIASNHGEWDEMPLTLYHPSDPLTGEHLPAGTPGVWDRQGIGFVRKPFAKGKLGGETWFDVERTAAHDQGLPESARILPRLRAGQPIEVSTGLFTENAPAPYGYLDHRGTPYGGLVARRYKPDHLAVLPDQVGACSIRDGCGILVNQRLSGGSGWAPISNSNPKGCNQHTGPGCGGEGAAKKSGALGSMFARIAQPDGGFTYSPTTDESPTAGYALSVYPERSFAKAAKDLTLNDLADYVLKNNDLLSKKEHYLGGWNDPASGKVFLDVSIVTQDQNRAYRLAREKDQIAYFDLGQGKSVTVNPLATSGGVVNLLGRRYAGYTASTRTGSWRNVGGGSGDSLRALDREGSYGGGSRGTARAAGGKHQFLSSSRGWSFLENANLKGCNQHTGPGCAGTTSGHGMEIREELHPLKAGAKIYRAYHPDGTPLYRSADTREELDRVLTEDHRQKQAAKAPPSVDKEAARKYLEALRKSIKSGTRNSNRADGKGWSFLENAKGPSAGKPCKPGQTAARTGCVPKGRDATAPTPAAGTLPTAKPVKTSTARGGAVPDPDYGHPAVARGLKSATSSIDKLKVLAKSGAHLGDVQLATGKNQQEKLEQHIADLTSGMKPGQLREAAKAVGIGRKLPNAEAVKKEIRIKLTHLYGSYVRSVGLSGGGETEAQIVKAAKARIKASNSTEYLTGNRRSFPSDSLDVSTEKACKIIRDGKVHGKKLTKRQRGMFGARCGERVGNQENGGEWFSVAALNVRGNHFKNCKRDVKGRCTKGAKGFLSRAATAVRRAVLGDSDRDIKNAGRRATKHFKKLFEHSAGRKLPRAKPTRAIDRAAEVRKKTRDARSLGRHTQSMEREIKVRESRGEKVPKKLRKATSGTRKRYERAVSGAMRLGGSFQGNRRLAGGWELLTDNGLLGRIGGAVKSFFGKCKRDAEGHCTKGTGGEYRGSSYQKSGRRPGYVL